MADGVDEPAQQDEHVPFLLYLEAERISNTGAWSWDVVSDRWTFSDQWHDIHGTPKRQLTNAELMPIAHSDDVDAIASAFAATLEKFVPYDVEHRIIRQDTGEVRYVRSLGRAQIGRSGEVEKVIGAARDVTEERRTQALLLKANKELERSNQELLQFSYRTSHDLKSPLTTIKSLAQFVVQDIEANCFDEAKKNSRIIIDQAILLENLVSGILEMAKVDIQKQAFEAISFATMLHDVLSSYSVEARQNDVTIAQSIVQVSEHALPLIRVHQVLANLVSNAIKFRDIKKDERYVNIRMSDDTGKIVIEVEDNGLGFPHDDTEAVFELFKKFHAKDVSGSGIGMYIVKKHVDALGGDITLRSSPKGTLVRVSFKTKGMT